MTPEARSRWRHAAVGLIVALGLGVVAFDFWRDDLRYSLPTPRRPGLEQPGSGTSLSLPGAVTTLIERGRPVLLHFFNADCPCSRFNLDHLRVLVRDYRDRMSFVAVLQGTDAARTVADFEADGLGIPAVVDAGGALAAQCGVYSTPQAVLVTGGGSLFFRGNYNLSRFCVDARTAFARQAIDALLAGRPLPAMPAAATTAYGCELPAAPAAEARRP